MIQTTKHPVIAAIEGEVSQTLTSFGYELVLMKFGGPPGNQTLTIYMDKPGGVTTGDCQYMAERLSVLLDTLDPIPGRYTLLLSSPGVDRPLTRDEDFDRFADKLAAVSFRDEQHKRVTLRGRLLGTAEGQLRLQTEQGEQLLPLDTIEHAHLVYEWQDTGKPALSPPDPPVHGS